MSLCTKAIAELLVVRVCCEVNWDIEHEFSYKYDMITNYKEWRLKLGASDSYY